MLSVLPSSTVEPPLKRTVPKLSSGTSRRPPLGASSIHSADDCEEAYCSAVWYLFPVVLLVKSTVQEPGAPSAMAMVIESPGPTTSGTVWEARGRSSTQAS